MEDTKPDQNSVMDKIAAKYSRGMWHQPRNLEYSYRYNAKRQQIKTPVKPYHLIDENIVNDALAICGNNYEMFAAKMRLSQQFIKNQDKIIRGYFDGLTSAKNYHRKYDAKCKEIKDKKIAEKLKAEELKKKIANEELLKKTQLANKAKQLAEKKAKERQIKADKRMAEAKKKAALIKELGLNTMQFKLLKKLIP